MDPLFRGRDGHHLLRGHVRVRPGPPRGRNHGQFIFYFNFLLTIYLVQSDGWWHIEEVRGESKSPHYKFGYFLSMSQQEVSAEIIPNSAVGIFSPKTEGTKT